MPDQDPRVTRLISEMAQAQQAAGDPRTSIHTELRLNALGEPFIVFGAPVAADSSNVVYNPTLDARQTIVCLSLDQFDEFVSALQAAQAGVRRRYPRNTPPEPGA